MGKKDLVRKTLAVGILFLLILVSWGSSLAREFDTISPIDFYVNTYYVDSVNGKDYNDGLSPDTAWKTTLKVSNSHFESGSKILFRRGQMWCGKISIRSSGTANDRIIFGTYGEGYRPIIHGVTFALVLYDSDFITIQDIDLRGGRNMCVLVQGSHYTIIENCTIGLNTKGWGIRATGAWSERSSSNYGIIRYCYIDSGLRGKIGDRGVDGIQLTDGAKYWEIYSNTIRAWPHSGISMSQIFEDVETAYNMIFSNIILGGDINYMRGFEMFGEENMVHHNEVFNNYICDTTITNHVEGNHNLVYYNIIDTVRNPDDRTDAHGFDLTIWYSHLTGSKYLVCHDNKIFNNVIYNSSCAGIQVIGTVNGAIPLVHDNEIKNNILLNTWGGITILDRVMEGNVYQNNLIYNNDEEKVISYRGILMNVAEFNDQNGSHNDLISGNIQADPMLINPIFGYFRPLNGSPVIDAGLDVGLSADYDGTIVPQSFAPDIGAYEYVEGYNNPPLTPTINGETNGQVGESYEYCIGYAFDPDGDSFFIWWDWGDETNSGWKGPYVSGEMICESHTWYSNVTYIIKAKLKDSNGAESNWGYLLVTMPVNLQNSHPLLQRFLDRFPNAFPILRYLIEL